jgi:hypothetical protein
MPKLELAILSVLFGNIFKSDRAYLLEMNSSMEQQSWCVPDTDGNGSILKLCHGLRRKINDLPGGEGSTVELLILYLHP